MSDMLALDNDNDFLFNSFLSLLYSHSITIDCSLYHVTTHLNWVLILFCN